MIRKILPIILIFLFGITHSKENTNIKTTLKANKTALNISDKDIDNLILESSFTDEYSGVTHYYFSQSYNGIKLYNSQLSIHVKDDKIVYSTPSQVKDLHSKASKISSQSISAKSAIQQSAIALKINNIGEIKSVKKNKEFQPVKNLSKYPVFTEQLFYYDDLKQQLVKVWKVNVFSDDHNNVWSIIVNASNGKVIEKTDQVIHCSFPKGYSNNDNNINNNNHSHSYRVINNTNNTQAVANPNAGAYNVFPYTTESPAYGPRVLISNPDNTTASPYGWHDTNGASGAEYTITRGNNVYAYVDADDNNSVDPNSSPDGGASLTFNYPLNFSVPMNSGNNQKAAVTNLFYMNNIMHDIFYQYGFTEAAGNFQSNNYGKGGLGNDYVWAEVQDGYSLDDPNMNNANFYATTDGVNFPFSRSRMQMYMWSGTPPSTLTYNAPSSIQGEIRHGAQSDWGPCSYNVTGAVANATSSTSPASFVCGPVNNASEIVGKIALIDRGECNFSDKVYNAQLAGAIGVIVIGRASSGDTIINMAPGTNAGSVTIPAVFVTYADGQLLRDNIGTANVTLFRESSTDCLDIDGSLDNGIIAHEYGHGISIRLTGGASSNTCLNNAEQMGEGWSDFFALALTQKPTDNKNTSRPMAVYANGEDVNGYGIRTYPYSYDMSVNPLTYADLASIEPYEGGETPVHPIGEIWAATIWDLYWNLIDLYGYDNDLYNGSGGNNIAIQLVMEGLKLQPCRPGFLDGRDAILAADSILYGGANKCNIWQTFARRGMGKSAIQGSSSNYSDQTAAFDLPSDCDLSLTANFGADKLEACVDETITFTDSTLGTPATWYWTFGDGNSSSVSNPTHSYSSAGNYNIKLVVTNSTDADSIVKSAFITIKSNPTVVASADVAICAGASTTLTVSGANTYSWSSGGTTNSKSVQPTTNTTYLVTGTTNGCSHTDSVLVTVKPKPSVTVNSPTICTGQSVTLTASGATTYAWNDGITTASRSVSPTVTTTYKVAGTTNGCTSDSVTATVTVTTTAPTITITSNQSGNLICTGQSITLTASGANNYAWNTGSTSNSITVSPTADSIFSVSGILTGCPTLSGDTTITVLVNTTIPTVSVNSPTICAGESATLTASGATTYTWSTTETGSSISVNPSNTTTYTVIGTTNKCSGNSISTVTVNPLPNTGTLTANASNDTLLISGSSGSNYNWYLNGVYYTSSSLPSLAIDTVGVFTVKISDGDCESVASNSVAINNTPIINNKLAVEFSILPNPNNGVFDMYLTVEKSMKYQLEIYNNIGQVFLSEPIQLQAGKNFKHISLSNIAKGTYFVKLSNNEGIATHTIVVQ